MADARSTLLECSVKLRQGRKWKSRWCVMTRQSPVSAEVILKFYKDQNALLRNKELSRERVCIFAENYCGLEYGFRYPKNVYVLTIVLSDSVILLSFPAHERLLEWYHRIKNTLPSETEFRTRVSIPSRAKLPPGRATLYFYQNHFAITPETPLRLLGAWDLSKVYRYGAFRGGFSFSVISSSKASVNHVLLLQNPEYISNHFDAAMSNHLANRFSTHSDINPATREDFQGTTIPEAQRLLPSGSAQHDNGKTSEFERMDDSNKENNPEAETLISHSNLADSNSNTRKHSEDSSFVDFESLQSQIELNSLENFRTSSQSDDPSIGSVQETVFSNAGPLFRPQNTPFREQEYEVMASFDHYRSSIHEDADIRIPKQIVHGSEYGPSSSSSGFYSFGSLGPGRRGGGGSSQVVNRVSSGKSRIQQLVSMDRFRLDLAPDVREYVNLPSPNSAVSGKSTIHNSLRIRRTNPLLPSQRTVVDDFDLSPPSSPPPPPPIQISRTNSLASSYVHSKETLSFQKLAPEIIKSSSDVPDMSSSYADIVAPVPFIHEDLVKPVGLMARLKQVSQDSDNISFIPSGSEYGDSSQYSSATNSRHNSFDRDFFHFPPPIPPKPTNLRSIDALLSSHSFSETPSLIERLLATSGPEPASGPSSLPDRVAPPIPPKPEHMRGRPLVSDPSMPSSPTGYPPLLPPRKRCNTVPSFASAEGDTEWVESKEPGEEGYLIMKPAYEDKLKTAHLRSKSVPDEESIGSKTLPATIPRVKTISSFTPPTTPPGRLSYGAGAQSPNPYSSMSHFSNSRSTMPHSPLMNSMQHDPMSLMQYVPQSPIHDSSTDSSNMKVKTLKRSATIGGFRQVSRSPSFIGKRGSLVRRASKQRRSSESTSTSRTSDISLGSIPKPRGRRVGQYGSLGERSKGQVDYKSEDSSLDIPESPAILPDDLPQVKDEFAGPLPLSPPSSANTSPQLSPVSSRESLNEETELELTIDQSRDTIHPDEEG